MSNIVSIFITAKPIWVERMTSLTGREGQDIRFTCITRPAKGDREPDPPIWSINGEQMADSHRSKSL